MSDMPSSDNFYGIKELIHQCWHAESKERPTIEEVLEKLGLIADIILDKQVFL